MSEDIFQEISNSVVKVSMFRTSYGEPKKLVGDIVGKASYMMNRLSDLAVTIFIILHLYSSFYTSILPHCT